MDNSADYMLQFFNCETREEGFNDNISTTFLHMHETEACLKDLIRMQIKHLDTAETLMPGIWEKQIKNIAAPMLTALVTGGIEQLGGTAFTTLLSS